MKNAPPDIKTVLQLSEKPLDYEYDIVGTTDGVRGTWHRLWAAIVSQKSGIFGDTEHAKLESERLVSDIRNEFETKFGRPLTDEEFDRLELFAEEHSGTISRR